MNKLFLSGRLGQNPKLGTTKKSGKPYATLSLAEDKSYVDKETGEKVERTEWHDCICYGGWATWAHEHLRAGDKILVEGRLEYTRNEEKKINFVNIQIENIPEIIDWKSKRLESAE
jgi:single-strand DNA-binding protein